MPVIVIEGESKVGREGQKRPGLLVSLWAWALDGVSGSGFLFLKLSASLKSLSFDSCRFSNWGTLGPNTASGGDLWSRIYFPSLTVGLLLVYRTEVVTHIPRAAARV